MEQKETRKKWKRRSRAAVAAWFRNSAGRMVDKRKEASRRACRKRVEVERG